MINQISQIESKGFRVERILWDSEAAVRSEGLNARIRSKVKTLETLEPGRHVAIVERKIQSIKKMFRSIKKQEQYSIGIQTWTTGVFSIVCRD